MIAACQKLGTKTNVVCSKAGFSKTSLMMRSNLERRQGSFIQYSYLV